MLRKKLGFFALAISMALPAVTEEKKDGGQPMTEEIEYEVKEKLDIEKPPPAIELNVKEIVESGTPQTELVLRETRPVPSNEDFAHYTTLNSNQVIKPWNPLIPTPPLVTFYPGLSKVATKRWEFKVSNEGGEVVKTIKGDGVPPRELQWDGRNERGEYITVGTLYSYQFITYDEHGNAHTFPGEPFQLDALRYEQKRKLSVEFAADRLFLEDQAAIRPTLERLWARAIDTVREYSNKPLLLEIYAESPNSPLAEERRQVLINSISNATNIPAVDIKHKINKVSDRGKVVKLEMSLK